MQQNIKSPVYLALLAGVLLLGACRKVIELDLNSVEKKYVIEATVVNVLGVRPAGIDDSVFVKISQTKDFNASNAFAGTSGAEITISDNGGTPVELVESATKGIYVAQTVATEIGHTYALSVKVGGQTFTSSAIMPDSVTFGRLYTENLEVFGSTKKVADVEFTDPVGKGNSYRFIQYKNGVASKPVFVQNDDLTDGRKITTQLNSYNNEDEDSEDQDLKAGDNLTVEMQCITPAVYKFWFSLNVGATGSGQNATPANPVSNISGGAMGYFSAHTSQFKSMVVR